MVSVTDPSLLRAITTALRGLGASMSGSAGKTTWNDLTRHPHGSVVVFIRRMG